VIENGSIIYTSREFQVVEDNIDRLLVNLISDAN
jgi:hypothetical protein